MKSVCVFLSASDKVSDNLKDEAQRLGQFLAQNKVKVIYGGASCGCMGSFARGVLSEGGELVGVIPEIDILAEVVEPNLTEKVLVRSMSERKEHMMERAEAFVVFPGGLGTLDEITDVLCLKALNSPLAKDKPVVFYNYMGFWEPFLESLEMMYQQSVISHSLDRMYQVFDQPQDVLDFISE